MESEFVSKIIKIRNTTVSFVFATIGLLMIAAYFYGVCSVFQTNSENVNSLNIELLYPPISLLCMGVFFAISSLFNSKIGRKFMDLDMIKKYPLIALILWSLMLFSIMFAAIPVETNISSDMFLISTF